MNLKSNQYSKKLILWICSLLFVFVLNGCKSSETKTQISQTTDQNDINQDYAEDDNEIIENEMNDSIINTVSFQEYSGQPVYIVNNNIPYFTSAEMKLGKNSFENYSDLDSLSRPQVAFASLSSDTMPPEGSEREEIGQVKPVGWETTKYDCINGNYVYNRCHLIAWCLSNENANEKNLITGTRYMNVDGMLSYEEMTAKYLDNHPNNHVLYRVTPYYTDNNLVCNGVLMEAYSIEDQGKGIQFCVYCYNVQPGIDINYTTGKTSYSGNFLDISSSSVNYTLSSNTSGNINSDNADTNNNISSEYILNSNTMKFHLPTCSSVSQMKEYNKKTYTGQREDLIAQGYMPCKNCNP